MTDKDGEDPTADFQAVAVAGWIVSGTLDDSGSGDMGTSSDA